MGRRRFGPTRVRTNGHLMERRRRSLSYCAYCESAAKGNEEALKSRDRLQLARRNRAATVALRAKRNEQLLSEFYFELPKPRTWVRFPSPAPDSKLMQLALLA